MSSVYKLLYGFDPYADLVSEDIASFGTEAFVISMNGLPQKRVPTDVDSFNFRGYTFNQCEDTDFWNITDDELLYLISNSREVT